MERQIYRGDIFECTNVNGASHVLPCDTFNAVDAFSPDYSDEGSRIVSVKKLIGVWYGRYSMPGYMDCTDWHYADIREELENFLDDMYGEEDADTDNN